MTTQDAAPAFEGPLTFEVSNVGGIDGRSVTVPPGVTVLAGENATNRTSFLQAVRAVLGSTDATLKADADAGSVTLRAAGTTHERTLTRSGDGVRFGGSPALEDTALADRYAFLLADNPVRRAVERGDDLYDVLMAPVDTDDIESRIESLQAEREALAAELDDVSAAAERLPALEQERVRLEERRDELEAEREALTDRVERLEAERDADGGDEAEALSGELADVEDELDDVEAELDRKEAKLSAVESELASLELPEADEAELETRREELREERRRVERRTDELAERRSALSNAQETNRRLLDADWSLESALRGTAAGADLPDGPLTVGADSGGSVTEELLPDGSVTCSSCGSTVDRSRLEAIADQYRALREQLDDEIESLRRESEALGEEIAEVEASLSRLSDHRERRRDLESTAENLETEIADLEDRRADLREELTSLREELDDLDSDDGSGALVDARTERNAVDRELSRVASDLDDVTDDIADAEALVERRAGLEADLESVRDRIGDLREEVERTETDLVERFNDAMDEVLGALDYDNLARVWLERRVDGSGDSRASDTDASFDLHVVREGEAGAYEDTLAHLSESERAVTGLVVALTGYLVHEVYETCPVLLFDSIEMIDSDRIAALVDYVAAYADYLVAALLPEDAAAVAPEATVVEW
jgi:predicted  nucleic acid-binding Zn-ribbon protein